jgi:hypothetical protein
LPEVDRSERGDDHRDSELVDEDFERLKNEAKATKAKKGTRR